MVTQSLFLAVGIGAPVVSYALFRARLRRFNHALLRENDSATLLAAVSKTMRCHDKNKIGTVATLNRIWRTHPGIPDPSCLPTLTMGNIKCSHEQWNLNRMAALLHEGHITSKDPRALDFPIVVIRWQGVDYLADGRRRINHFIRTHNQAPQDILLVELLDVDDKNYPIPSGYQTSFAIAA